MAPKKRPASLQNDVDAGQTTRQGFKDVQMLATALGPHVSERFFTTYTTSRSNKDLEKKKLLSK